MFSFFKKKPTIQAISIPDFGWEQDKDEASVKLWFNQEETIALSVNFFDTKPDIPSIKDIDVIRSYYRTMLTDINGGLVQVDLVDLKGYAAIKTIFKVPQNPSGMSYLASLTIPFAKYSYVIKIQAPEMGMTGIRDAVIAEQLLAAGKLTIGEKGYEGWFADPYDASFEGGSLMNLSEQEEYDGEFAEHPLSVAREFMNTIEREVDFGEVLKGVKGFGG